MPRRSLALVVLAACAPSQEAVRVELPVRVGDAALPEFTTDLGYRVALTRARISVQDLEFTVQGEMHASLGARLWRQVVPSAWAHPGHYAGGDVTGALPGAYVLSWPGDGDELGVAELLTGDYHGLNFGFRAADELADGDPLRGHVAVFEGAASRDGEDIPFLIALDVDAGAQMVGAPFDHVIDEGAAGVLTLDLVVADPASGATLFDGVDFAALPREEGATLEVGPGEEAHNIARRAIQSHVHYAVTLAEGT